MLTCFKCFFPREKKKIYYEKKNKVKEILKRFLRNLKREYLSVEKIVLKGEFQRKFCVF